MPGLIHYSNVLKSRPYKANVLFDCLSHHLLINTSHANTWKGLITACKIKSLDDRKPNVVKVICTCMV